MRRFGAGGRCVEVGFRYRNGAAGGGELLVGCWESNEDSGVDHGGESKFVVTQHIRRATSEEQESCLYSKYQATAVSYND